MFENFTNGARRVMDLARQEAGRLGATCIAPEHLLLGLAKEDNGIAACVLKDPKIGFDFATLKGIVDRLVEHRPMTLIMSRGVSSLSDATKQVVQLAIKKAGEMDNHYIGTEHLLLGLLGAGDAVGGIATQILVSGANGQLTRIIKGEILRLLGCDDLRPQPGQAVLILRLPGGVEKRVLTINGLSKLFDLDDQEVAKLGQLIREGVGEQIERLVSATGIRTAEFRLS